VAGGPAAVVGEEDDGAPATAPLVVEPASVAGGAIACAGGTRLADPLEAAVPLHAASSAMVATSGPDRSGRPPR
jgi:hypothetical protein